MKTFKFYFAGITILAISILISCRKEAGGDQSPTVTANAAAKKTILDAPAIACGAGSTQTSINLTVTAGASGAPAGFSIQWMTLADYTASGWPSNSDDPANPTSFCKASFSGNANLSRYSLAAGESVNVNVGEFLFDNGASTNCPQALKCGTAYVFRAFAHASSTLSKSAFSANTTCSTLACGNNGGCTFTQGYWKTHGPTGCNPSSSGNVWPVTSLTLGTATYTDLQICSILNTPASGNGLIALAHQLIAAKLNIAKGADASAIQSSLNAADALIGSLVIPPVGSGTLAPAATSSLITALTAYNEGATGPGHCD